MRPTQLWFGFMIGLIVCLTAGTLSARAADELSALKSGQVLVKELPPKTSAKDALPTVSAKILIPKPPSEVWKAVMQPEQLMQRERKVKQIRVVNSNGTTKDLNYTVSLAKILPTFNYTLRHEPGSQPNTLQFKRLNGSFNDIQGSWQVTPVDNGKSSVLTYNLSIDPGPLVPRFMLQNVLKSDLPGMMQNVKSVIAPGN